MTSAQIRQGFLDFFIQKHAHTFVASSPVVPVGDPTLLFTNAGMNQFKPIFLGQEKREYTRAVNTQKCIRAGGKHNDLDDVGRSRRHHTFFEMLGNWSFGDYFKQGAIEMSWELLTKVWKLDPTRLHVTCFEGDEKNGVPRDTEAADIWRKVANWEQCGHKSDDHIHYFGKDNFWEMGDTGPCGPCTEIYYDRTEDKSGKSLVNGEDPRVMEIWNNVFIQYNRNPDRTLVTLPAQHVDTGMGFERICQVLQNVGSNYDIDLFNPFWEKLKELSGKTYTGKFPKTNVADAAAEAADPQLRYDIAMRVIADHARCLTFALTDGATPSNEGRGYVLRRILRRAVRFGRQQLELKDPFLYKLVSVVGESMGDAFPELKKNPGHVVELIKDEEASFGKTLDRGITLFTAVADSVEAYWNDKYYSTNDNQSLDEFENISNKTFIHQGDIEAFIKAGRMTIPEYTAFKLHDTHGFPIDLTQIMAVERGMRVDVVGYERLMLQAKELARAGGKDISEDISYIPPAALSQLQRERISSTDDSAKFTPKTIRSNIVALWNGVALQSTHTVEDDKIAVLLDKTNFYAEMGGQVGDVGNLTSEKMSFEVKSTKIIGGYVLHIGEICNGSLNIGDVVFAAVSDARKSTQKNHTATHIANWALREVLGDAVQQKGSLVDPHKLRFDFSHGKSLSDDELARVEVLVNQQIGQKLPVYAEEAPQGDALKINGLRAVFGEKYPPMVRVVSVGASVDDLLKDPSRPDWRKYSIEFCGGTHVRNTEEIGAFVITAEESVSKGVRRLVAVSGSAASAALSLEKEIAGAIEKAKQSPESDIPALVTSLQRQSGAEGVPLRAKRRVQAAVIELQQKLKAWEKSQKQQGSGLDVAAIAADLIGKEEKGLIVSVVDGATDDELRSVMDSIKTRLPTFAAMLCAASEGKVSFVAGVSEDLIKKGLRAGDWVKETSKVTGGGGGGRPNLAMGSGKDASMVADALVKAREIAGTVV